MSDDSVVDSTIDLKKRARRRLVGAAALALLAVIVLPIVMDSEPKPSGQDIQIRIPSKDNDSLIARALPARPAPIAPHDEIDKTKTVATNAKPAATEAVEPTVKPEVSPAAAPLPAPPLKPVTETLAAKAETVKKAEVAHAEAALEGKDSAQWIVQLGAYQNAANVKQLTAKLKEMGLASYTERLDSPQGVRTRVRAGPFKSREAADKARLRIKKIGVDGTVGQK